MDNENGEPSPAPGAEHAPPAAAPDYSQYQAPRPPDASATMDQTQTMPAALEELPPLGQTGTTQNFFAPPTVPAAPAPSYGQPSYEPPGYAQPTYAQPTYEQPSYEQPTSSYGQPPTAPSGYGQPPEPTSSYGQPPTTPSGYGQPPEPTSSYSAAPQYPSYADQNGPGAPAEQHTAIYPPVGGGYGSDAASYGQATPLAPPSRFGQPGGYGQPTQAYQPPPSYGQAGGYQPAQPTQAYPPAPGYEQPAGYAQNNYQESSYGQPGAGYGQTAAYGQPDAYAAQTAYQQPQQYGSPAPSQYGYGPGSGAATGQSPYGAGAPAGAGPSRAPGPAKKSHVGLWTLLVVGIVIVIVGAITFIAKPSFLFKKVLDHTAVEQTIQSQSQGVLTNVSCPANEKVKSGVTFQCTANSSTGSKKVTVTIKDSKANYVWSPSS